MTKQISEYTVEELSAKIEAIKAEREKTANALKRYEEELERKKQEVPLGIPLEEAISSVFSGYQFGFSSEKSQRLFHARLTDYVEALRKLAKGEPIDILVLLPLLKKGYVAMDKNGDWYWYSGKPVLRDMRWSLDKGYGFKLGCFNIKPADNWETSLMECGLCTC